MLVLALAVAPCRSADSPALSIYGSLPVIERVALSPSGSRTAIVGEFNDKRQILIVEGQSKPLLTVTVGDVKVRGIYWAGEDTVLLYTSVTSSLSPMDFTTDKAELSAMLVLPLKGREAWSVFGGDRKITGGVRGFYGVRRKDGKYYGYFGGMVVGGTAATAEYLKSTNPVLFEVDLETRKVRKIAPNIEGNAYRDWVIGVDGEIAATLDYRSGTGDWVIRNSDGKHMAEGTSPTGGISLVGMGTAPDTIVYALEDDSGNDHWIELPTSGGEGKPLLEGIGIREAVFDEQTQQLAGYTKQGDVPAYSFLDPYRQKVIDATLKAFPGKSVHLRDWNEEFNKLIAMTEGDGDPQTWWMVDIKTGKANDLGVSYRLRAADVGPVRMIHYKAADGLDIPAVLTLPPGVPEKNLPVVVMPHGGPGARDYPGFDWWAQAFASRGYAVLQPNFRGSTGYGMPFLSAGYGEWGRKMQSDLSDGLSFLVEQGIAAPGRACIVGASYGGYAAQAGVTLQKGIYRCAVSVAGISDLAKMVNSDVRASDSDATLIRNLKQEIGSGRDLRAVSPIRYVDSADAPILLIHGKDDTVVDFDQSVAMAKALEKAGKPVEFVTLEGEDHWLSRSETRNAMLQAAVAFVEKHNPVGPAQ
jgi:dipeptidyl aminopeptidase/acylaminoacyl peptidase